MIRMHIHTERMYLATKISTFSLSPNQFIVIITVVIIFFLVIYFFLDEWLNKNIGYS